MFSISPKTICVEKGSSSPKTVILHVEPFDGISASTIKVKVTTNHPEVITFSANSFQTSLRNREFDLHISFDHLDTLEAEEPLLITLEGFTVRLQRFTKVIPVDLVVLGRER